MSGMNGNPHAEDAARYVNEASSLHDWHDSERPIIAANAQALATLALAYEQRTANLLHALEISLRAQGVMVTADIPAILARLGLNDGATA